MYVILRYFLDLDLKIKDSFKTKNIATSTLIITCEFWSCFIVLFFLPLDKSQISLGVSRGESQVLFKKAFLEASCSILMNYYILATKTLRNSSTPAQFFLVYTYNQAWTEEIARMQLVIERAPGLHNNGDSN